MGQASNQMIEIERREAERQREVPERLDDALEELSNISTRLEEVLRKFEPVEAKGIFLSHAGADKEMVRRFMLSLRSVGLGPWLDEDNLPAGTPLHRGILQGFKDSCAAVFFITPNFKDYGFLRKEIDYAIDEERRRPEDFRIITLVMETSLNSIPDLLRPYVWKEPRTELDAFAEIIKALPIRTGPGAWIKDV